MTLHTRISLNAAVDEILAGKREVKTQLEKFAVIEALNFRAPEISYDPEAATLATIDAGLEAQALAAAPASIRGDKALARQWLLASRRGRAAKPPIAGARIPAAPAPEVPGPEALYAARESLARDALTLEKHSPLPDDYPQQLAERGKSGRFGRLGSLLDAFSEFEQAKLQVIDRAFARADGTFSKLASLHRERDQSGKVCKFETHRKLTPMSRRDLPHPQGQGCGPLVFLCEVRELDAPPADLAEGLGHWEFRELKGVPAGCYAFVPASAEKV